MNKTVKVILGVFALLVLMTGSFAGGFVTRHALEQSSLFPGFSHDSPITLPFLTQQPPAQSSTPVDQKTLFAPFWETWTIIHQQYVAQPVDDAKLMEGAINGMLQTLDVGRNYYSNPEELKQLNQRLNGDYEGIGAYVSLKGDYLTITSPIKGSPADQAGLKPGDMIVAVDGKDMTGVATQDVLQKVLGPAGTQVTLTIFRQSESKHFDVTITRAKINASLITSEMRPDGIAYIYLSSFGNTADQQLRAALEELLAQNPKGLILDLRYNGGGYLDQGVAVASEFLPKDKIVVYQKYGDGRLEEYPSTGEGIALQIPMVVLVNEGSASASEIVAGALQDYGRAKLVGVTSYGKGSVQSLNMLKDDRGMVAITSAQWLTPNKRLIQGLGLTPDVYVTYTQADYDAGLDPQLDAAVATLNALVNNTAIPTSQPIPTTMPVP